MGKLLTSHRSTSYPCYLPVLGRFEGAGRIRLTRDKNSKIIEQNVLLTNEICVVKNVSFAH
jgi:hypothetical protein